MSMIWRFGIEWYGMEIRHDVSRREECMKNFCEYIREHAMKVINLKKKKMIPLTNEQHESYEKAKICKKKVRIIQLKKFLWFFTIDQTTIIVLS